ncbi:MAG: DNA repair protein RecO [Burkholderiales bacterium]|nr:DNA repair protein RecO [Burkholderiales bacterium]
MARAVSKPSSAAYVLHSHDWSESSLILDLFTRDHGRVVAVAKGAKRPYSQLRPVLMPFQRLNVTFGARRTDETEVWLMRQAEWAGGPAWAGGAALLPGFYLNELLMRLLARHDPHPGLFDAYAQVLPALTDPALLQAALRAFEVVLLRQLGHLPDLSTLTVGGAVAVAGQRYELSPQWGVSLASRASHTTTGRSGGDPALANATLDGAVLLQLEAALSTEGEGGRTILTPAMAPVMAACLPALTELKTALRTLLHYHLGSHPLRTRQLMMELQQA